MIPKPTLSDIVNLHYYRWVTSPNESVRYQSLKVFYSKLRSLTRGILYNKYRKKLRIFEDIFSDMIYKVCYSKQNNLIGTTDSFCSWYRKALTNYMTNLNRDRNRMKRVMIEYESNSLHTIDEMEEIASYEYYLREERLTEVNDIINIIMKNQKDRQLLHERYILGIPEIELAQKYGTTENGIKSRLKRAKKQMQVTYETIGKTEFL
ncbi:MAG: sigma-70 family RNA polymerase sigma factor [Ignavibacteriae bacterium]|nr:sigma-70 family RNA polymerase sigma factor [Ignavibacteriota bacterium]